MKNTKRIIAALLLLTLGVTFASCVAEDNDPPASSAVGEESTVQSVSTEESTSEESRAAEIPTSIIKGVDYINPLFDGEAYYNANARYMMPADLISGSMPSDVSYEKQDKTLNITDLTRDNSAYIKQGSDTSVTYEELDDDTPLYLGVRTLMNRSLGDEDIMDLCGQVESVFENLGIYAVARFGCTVYVDGLGWASDNLYLPEGYLDTRATYERKYEDNYYTAPGFYYVAYATKGQIEALKSYLENEGKELFCAQAYPLPNVSAEEIAYPDPFRVSDMYIS